ncbi:2-C-methyl-D-erythritol 2,4-cyclodiphosphate synthase/2-C-methyl-D-erythritol 4-phosphate cytidylyltransferase [alpha proteobacterium HIMB59]|nr:2-C-methyl-D-erythritol 2,4-cyclodiphosphate synthase/2-C-methyl-D-erythritol 4-phosphate cytidylyltransferase [alpha proteobacterium HIMB59]
MTLKLSNIHIVLLAAGKSTRFKAKENKLLSKLNDKTIIEHSIEQLTKIGFKKITLVISNNSILRDIKEKDIELIKGGKTRTLSVKNALTKSKIKAKYIFIHDAARILASEKILKKLVKETYKDKYDCIIPFSKCADTVIKNHTNLKREDLKLIKTPQVFLKKKIVQLHAINKNYQLTDDSILMRNNPKEFKIKYLLDNSLNFKVTYKEDLENLSIKHNQKQRVGLGYDIHKIQKINRYNKIKLGGISIKSKVKVISHSDGDVILHAITDSILGALSLRDIGTYFPNNKINENRNSKEFLDFALTKLKNKNFKINNIDLMIVSEIPKINPYYEKMIKSLIRILQIDKNQITIKATTNEKSGLIGKSEFIACWSNLSIY